MRYIHLNNDSYIIHTTKGTHSLTKESFNFHKIKRMLSNNVEEDKILPLLEPPTITDGIYKAYVSTDNNVMYYKHFTEVAGKVEETIEFLVPSSAVVITAWDKYVGIYTSKEDLILDWPEYVI